MMISAATRLKVMAESSREALERDEDVTPIYEYPET